MLYYPNILFKLKCAPDILALNLFPNVKEWTESYGAYNAVKRALGTHRLGDREINLVSVGDGHTPRTAALFAFMSAWTCHSVDPALKNKEYKVHRLSLYRKKVEEIDLNFGDRCTVIVGVHAHVSLQETLKHIRGTNRHLFFMPCCLKPDLPTEPDDVIIDRQVLSEHNKLLVWHNV